jgi:hypothetical protein
MMAYFLVHRGPAPCFLSELAYNIVAFGPAKAKATIANVRDESLRARLAEVFIYLGRWKF